MKNTFFTSLFIAPVLAATALAADTGTIQGKVVLGKGMKEPAGAVIFIAARPASGGPPLAVKRIADAHLPVEFTLGPGDAMMGGSLAGSVEITARASQSGDAMTRTPGDLWGKVKTQVGGGPVTIKLDHKI